MKSVCLICQPYHRGGVTRWMADAALEFVRQGKEVFFITITPEFEFISSGGKPAMVELINSDRIHVIAPKQGYIFELSDPLYRADVYRKCLEKHVPIGTPVIVSDDLPIWIAVASVVSKYKMIGVLHGDDQLYYSRAKRFEQSVYRFIAISNRIARKTKENLINKDTDIPVIPCGIPLDNVQYTPKKEKNNITHIIWVGRISEEAKRVSDLPKIANALRVMKIPFILEIIGNGPEMKSLRDAVDEQGLNDHVLFCGWLSQQEIYQKMLISDILILCSNFEGMSIVVMEALASGCSVVSTRISGIEDLEKNPLSKNALFVYQVGDINDAVEKVQESITVDVSTRKQASRTLAEKCFSIEECINGYNQFIFNTHNRVYQEVHYKYNRFDKLISRTIATVRLIKYYLIH